MPIIRSTSAIRVGECCNNGEEDGWGQCCNNSSGERRNTIKWWGDKEAPVVVIDISSWTLGL